MPRTVDKTAAGTPAPGKIGARRRGTRIAAARPQHNACTYRPSFHLPHYVDPFSGSGPFGTTVPGRVHRQHRVPVWARAGPSTRRFRRAALIVAPLLSPNRVHRNLFARSFRYWQASQSGLSIAQNCTSSVSVVAVAFAVTLGRPPDAGTEFNSPPCPVDFSADVLPNVRR